MLYRLKECLALAHRITSVNVVDLPRWAREWSTYCALNGDSSISTCHDFAKLLVPLPGGGRIRHAYTGDWLVLYRGDMRVIEQREFEKLYEPAQPQP